MSIELQLNTMTVEEKVRLLEQVWDNLCQDSGNVRSPDWHAAILEGRRKALSNGSMPISAWTDAKRRLLALGE